MLRIPALLLAATLALALHVGAQADVFARADAALDRGDAGVARALIDDALAGARGADRVPLLRHRGYIEVLMRRYGDATATFREVLRLAPDDAYSRVELAARLAADGRFDEASRVLAAAPQTDDVTAARAALAEGERLRAEVLAKVDAGHRTIGWLAAAAAGLLAALAVLWIRLTRGASA